MPNAPAVLTYVVLRQCCTSGNCGVCARVTPYGKTIDVEQYRTGDKAKAEQVARNWAAYKARVENA